MKMINKTLDNIDGPILDTIENQSKEYFSRVTREDGSTLSLRIKTKILNPVSDLKVGVNAKESGGGAEIQFKTQANPNIWLWVTVAAVFLIGLVIDGLLVGLMIDGGDIVANLVFAAVLGGILYWRQKSKLDKDFDLMLSELEFNNRSGSVGAQTA